MESATLGLIEFLQWKQAKRLTVVKKIAEIQLKYKLSCWKITQFKCKKDRFFY